jgi:DNA (cytosine-5)-methyltransferase 1
MTAYYNEWDKGAAAWLRELIKMGLIADGVVDERSITDVQASDLKGFTQIHLFAGIAGWSQALRMAGWADDRPVLTASLPCQSFSVAGKQLGKADERHLLPHVVELVRKLMPQTMFGEQVEAAIAHEWLDDLHDEFSSLGYEVASSIIPAAAVGAPHIRSRIWWVANLGKGNV